MILGVTQKRNVQKGSNKAYIKLWKCLVYCIK